MLVPCGPVGPPAPVNLGVRLPEKYERDMNAINHAATALAINRRWPGVPIIPVLISVQVVELLWVVLNLLGIERTELGPAVESMKDVHLVHMPYSHSLATTGALAIGVWFLFAKLFNKAQWGVALGVGVFSHTILDVLVHSHDMAIAPGIPRPLLGTGLYDIPMVALAVETLFGLLCWKYYRGSKPLLAVILVFNLGAISFYSADIPGPEVFMAGRPEWFVAFIGVHILMGLTAIWFFARSTWRVSLS
jgi:hypothetical protein